MRIGELAQQAEVRASAIRYYERRGLLSPPVRMSRGQRRYHPEALARLAFIRLAQSAGLTLSEIRHLLYDFPPSTTADVRWRSIRSTKLAALEEQIKRIKAARG